MIFKDSTAWCTRSALHEERLPKVQRVLLSSGARSVLDLGCGPGELFVRLVREWQFGRIVGIDVFGEALRAAEEALRREGLPDSEKWVLLLQASFSEPDARLAGFDAAALVETIEHIDPQRLSSVEHAVFASHRPGMVIVTTPNFEYNVLYGMPDGAFRHEDHRFEWTRARFCAWSFGVARRNGYVVAFDEIGEAHPLLGSPTQMATFKRRTQ
jgi:3' terminal RNA ribose 2'-O-methyltransferase Hen1